MNGNNRRPVMKDVARLAGVSQATVSLVLNDVAGSGISDETRARVRKAARDLGYRSNAMARNLKLQRSNTIGFLSDHITTTPYAVKLMQGAHDAARAVGKHLLIVNGDDPEAVDDAVDELLERRVEGIAYAAMYNRMIDVPPAMLEVRSIVVDGAVDHPIIPAIAPDEFAAAVEATSYLIDHGHTEIAHLTRSPGTTATDQRVDGYLEAMTRAGLDNSVRIVRAKDSTTPSAFAASLELLQDDDLTAVFCFNDEMAMGLYQAAAEVGLRVPEQLSVVGVDDLQLIACALRPPLTTMRLPHYEMGKLGIEMLMSTEWRTHPIAVACTLVERASVATREGAGAGVHGTGGG